MAGQTIEFPNIQAHTDPLATCHPSSNPMHISAKSSFDDALETDWHEVQVGINRHSCTEEPRRNTRVRFDKSSRFATITELSASIAHQLRQPLTSMLANAQAAKRWLATEPPNLMEAIASIERIARDARIADETIERIRALFKRECLHKKEASIPEMVSEAVRSVLEDPHWCEVPIKWHSEEDLPKVWVDPLAIQEVFINLISNAIEALENNGDSPLVEVQAAINDENEIVIQVIDNGPGIGEMEGIFDAFVTSKKNGLGIGLALSRSIAEAHGARLWAENNPNGGAAFCLALPLSPREQISSTA